MHTNNTRITWLVLHNAYNVHIIHTSSYYFYITWEHHAYPNCRRVVPFSLIVLTKRQKNAFFRCAFRGAVPIFFLKKKRKKGQHLEYHVSVSCISWYYDITEKKTFCFVTQVWLGLRHGCWISLALQVIFFSFSPLSPSNSLEMKRCTSATYV